MKLKNYITLLSVAALFTACDLDKYPEGGTVLQDQKEDVIKNDPSKMSAEMNALKAILTEYGGRNHTDFGVPSINLYQDCSGQDMVSEQHGYNWYQSALLFRDRLSTNFTSNFMWSFYYGHVKAANDVLKTLYASYPDENQRVDDVANYIGQALASRAFDYMELIQVFQFTYLGHEDALGLPMVKEDITAEQSQNNPRIPVKEVYAQIMQDLDQAIEYLSKYPVKRVDKAQITAEVAYGLRARANMLMGKYAEAASDAENAMKGAEPYSIAEVSVPSFNDANASSWIWGIVITEENDVVKTGIINYPSHLCSLTGNGYTTGVGVNVVFKRINSNLYAHMDESDVRKSWFVDEKGQSQALNNAYGEDGPVIAGALGYPPYTNVKFGPNDNVLLNPTNAQDYPLMRAEEMLLIKAEALARTQGVAAGKAVLEGFLKTYRAPGYVCTASSVEDFVDEIWKQRRIELWGEGFSLKDVLRLKKPIIRKGANFSPNVTFENIAPESAIMIYNIPEAETNVNKGITLDQINEVATPPVPLN